MALHKIKSLALAATSVALLGSGGSALAIPTLQLGAPCTNTVNCGTYANYSGGTNPSETNTAFTSGSKIYVGASYGQNDKVVSIGGENSNALKDYSAFLSTGTGSNKVPYTGFDGQGAILMATVSGLGSLKIGIDGSATFMPFLSIPVGSDNHWPNKHAPTQNPALTQYFFFDLGEFDNSETVPNFVDESGSDKGEIKDIALDILGDGFDWIHFDMMALITTVTVDGKKKTDLYSSDVEVNPNSKDVTWKKNGGGDDDEVIPEPGSIALAGLALLGLAASRRRNRKA